MWCDQGVETSLVEAGNAGLAGRHNGCATSGICQQGEFADCFRCFDYSHALLLPVDVGCLDTHPARQDNIKPFSFCTFLEQDLTTVIVVHGGHFQELVHRVSIDDAKQFEKRSRQGHAT